MVFSIGLEHSAGVEILRRALLEEGPIVHRDSGSRSIAADEFLPRAWAAAKKIGVTRVARVSDLVDVGYPVFQAARPEIWAHQYASITTGGFGKGASEPQATLSCLMECLESYAMEPRQPLLIRSSFRRLSRSYLVPDPRTFACAMNCESPTEDEMILWTRAYCPPIDAEVMVPAEHVYFPLNVGDYGTRKIFPSGYNGYAAGTSYLDATIHGLYELIERKLMGDLSEGRCEALEFIPENSDAVEKLLGRLKSEYRVEVFLLKSDLMPALPVCLCRIHGPLGVQMGWGCHFDFDVASERSVSEAVQVFAALASASREDLWHTPFHSRRNPDETDPLLSAWPRRVVDGQERREIYLRPRKITRARYIDAKNSSGHQQFGTLRAEFAAQQAWLKQAGYPLFYVANKTPREIDIPIVTAVVPEMKAVWTMRFSEHYSKADLVRYRFRNMIDLSSSWTRENERAP